MPRFPVSFSWLIVLACILSWRGSRAQNIIANPEFDDLVKCCEYRIYHACGWFYIGSPDHKQKIDNRGFLKVLCYNDTNRFYGIVLGSLIKPVHRGQQVTLRIKLKKKATFYLHSGFVQQHNYRTDEDTGAFASVTFTRTLVPGKKRMIVTIAPEKDSCNYIAFRFEDVLNIYGQLQRVLIESVEVTDATEKKKGIAERYFDRIRRIYSNVQWHNFTVPCQSNRTLNRD